MKNLLTNTRRLEQLIDYLPSREARDKYVKLTNQLIYMDEDTSINAIINPLSILDYNTLSAHRDYFNDGIKLQEVLTQTLGQNSDDLIRQADIHINRSDKSLWHGLTGASDIYNAKYNVAENDELQEAIRRGLMIRFFDEVDITSLSIVKLAALYGMVTRTLFVVGGNPFRDWNQILMTAHLKRSDNSSLAFSKNPYLKSFSRGYGNCVRVNIE